MADDDGEEVARQELNITDYPSDGRILYRDASYIIIDKVLSMNTI
jgi:hypothetical protein